MVKQSRALKLSSRVKKLQQALDAVSNIKESRAVARSAGTAALLELSRLYFEDRRRLLIELANMRTDGVGRLRKLPQIRMWSLGVLDVDLLQSGQLLAELWKGASKERAQTDLLQFLQLRQGYRHLDQGITFVADLPWIASFEAGHVVPSPVNFHAQVTQGVLEHHTRFGICHNPDCLAPYFIKRRKDQKHCERGECTEYTQRQHALNWWNTTGKKKRRKQVMTKKASSTAESKKGGKRWA